MVIKLSRHSNYVHQFVCNGVLSRWLVEVAVIDTPPNPEHSCFVQLMVVMLMACTSVAVVVLQVDYSRRLNKSDIFGASDLESDDDGSRHFARGALLLLCDICILGNIILI